MLIDGNPDEGLTAAELLAANEMLEMPTEGITEPDVLVPPTLGDKMLEDGRLEGILDGPVLVIPDCALHEGHVDETLCDPMNTEVEPAEVDPVGGFAELRPGTLLVRLEPAELMVAELAPDMDLVELGIEESEGAEAELEDNELTKLDPADIELPKLEVA